MKPEMVALFLHIDLDEPDEEIIKELSFVDGEAYADPINGGYWCRAGGITLIEPGGKVKARYKWPEFLKVLRAAGQDSMFEEGE